MKIKYFSILFLAAGMSAIMPSCSKNDDDSIDVAVLKKEILADIANNVCKASYEDMFNKSSQLLTAVNTLKETPSAANLEACRTLWKDIRNTWEQSESWLFGPVSTDDIDPRIDTWPVDFNALETVLAGNAVINESYINGLEESLKGFHPIEYLLWGQNGTKTVTQFTMREYEYLVALAGNLKNLSSDVNDSWQNGYANQLATAGNGSEEFTSALSAYVQLVDAMAGICDEVANGKIQDPFDLSDPTQEESPFAKNSIIDFTNNIKGVMDVYQGKFNTDGKGIEDLVRQYNLSLDNEIKTAHADAIASLTVINVPFGEAILSKRSDVQNAMEKINVLAEVLDTKLKPFLEQYAN